MSAYSGGPGIHLQHLVLDSTITKEQKADCLKLLKVVVKNLADPIKCQDVKFKQLRMGNEKIKANILSCQPHATEYLKGIGFGEATTDEGEAVLRINSEVPVDVVFMQASLVEVSNAYSMVAGVEQTAVSSPSRGPTAESNKKIRIASPEKTTTYLVPTKMSEKQKARILMEEKAKREKDEAKRQRAITSAQIKTDKYVRENDPNWKSGVSAAAAKSGTGMSTFRDRYGE